MQQCNELIQEGIQWTYGSVTYHSNVKFSIMAADSAARCLLQGLRQFNGECSCPWCYAKGQHYEVCNKFKLNCRFNFQHNYMHIHYRHALVKIKNGSLSRMIWTPTRGLMKNSLKMFRNILKMKQNPKKK